MLSTPNLQLQKKTFCQAQTCLHKNGINILAVDITIDHLNSAFTTKSIWTQGRILFQQSTLLRIMINVLFFPPVSRKSESMTNSGGNRSQAQRVKLTVFPDAGQQQTAFSVSVSLLSSVMGQEYCERDSYAKQS